MHEILIAGLLLAILFVTARSATDMSLLLVFVFVLYRLQPRVKDFEACRVRLAALAASVDAVVSILDASGKKYVQSGTLMHPGLDDAIVFDGVSFRLRLRQQSGAAGCIVRDSSGQDDSLRRPIGRREINGHQIDSSLLRSDRGTDPDRTAGHSETSTSRRGGIRLPS